MANKIKCSYDKCFKHFTTPEAMKKHKAKDSAHDYYCKKCDLDCNDDTELLYHQITSERHMACPMCGREFKSESGRDRHVEIDHVPKQRLTCVGCQLMFERASSLMAHIERDECNVIRFEHFSRQKAEKQIVKDVLEAAMDPTAGSTVLSSARTYHTADNEMNLLDDDRAFVNRDWQGRPEVDEEHERNGPYVGPPTTQLANMSISKFPPLVSSQAQSSPTATANPPSKPDNGPDMIDFNQEPTVEWPNDKPAWSDTKMTKKLFNNNIINTGNMSTISSSTAAVKPKPSQSINLLDTFSDDDGDGRSPTTNDHNKHHNTTTSENFSTRAAPASAHPVPIPPSTRAPNPDPNFPNTQIKLQRLLPFPTHLQIDRFYDTTLDVYICPGQNCGVHFRTVDSFRDHLVSGIHSRGPVRCPGCLKKFKTTTGLVAHCESGSRKCKVRSALDFDGVLRDVSGGLLRTDGLLEDGSVRLVAQDVVDW